MPGFAPRFPLSATRRSRILISVAVNAIAGSASGAARAIIVIHNTRQLTIQNSATRLMPKPAILVAATVDAFGEADVARVPALIGELRRILKHEDLAFGYSIPPLGRLKVARQNFRFLDLWVGKEPICGFGTRPVLTGQRDCSSHSIAQAAKQIAESAPETGVSECGLIDLAARPVVTQKRQCFAVGLHRTSRVHHGARD